MQAFILVQVEISILAESDEPDSTPRASAASTPPARARKVRDLSVERPNVRLEPGDVRRDLKAFDKATGGNHDECCRVCGDE